MTINHVSTTNEKPADSSMATTSTAKSAESKKRGRSSMKFEEASNRTKRRIATDLHKSQSTLELSLATEMSFCSSEASNAASIVKEITTTLSTRADKYRTTLKLSATSRITTMSGDSALSDVIEGKLSKHQYLLIRKSMKKHNALTYPAYEKILEAKV
ncbi:uncharacterized protein LOC105199863 [Solenopsis invicta]|uniref:uncharacterized protein LOC105199863 n=1 Tax=Solenopsis invicta TaxID=13686 RepID=UPI000595C6E8|nr:uncharacterized protein LOC105199863 [Solenopsis invicta]